MCDLESIHDKMNRPPILEFEGFVIRPFDGWNLWFENPSGEGTQIRKIEFLAWLSKMFNEGIQWRNYATFFALKTDQNGMRGSLTLRQVFCSMSRFFQYHLLHAHFLLST